MATRDFKNLPKAAQPGQATDIGKRNQDIDKYLADQIEKPEVADAAKQTYTQQQIQQNELLSGATAPFSDDCEVSATEYYSAPNCLYFIDQTGTGGPQDILLMFDNTPNITQSNINTLITPYISGVLTYSHMMKVVSGKTGYFS